LSKKKINCSFSSEEAILKIGRFIFTYSSLETEEESVFVVKVARKTIFTLSKKEIELRLAKGDSGTLWSPEEYLLAGVGIYVADEGILK